MKLFITYCIVLLFGCMHFSNEGNHNQQQGKVKAISTIARQQLTFKADIQPILSARCQPCHFTGGIMYARLPFDTAATVYELGEELFTRIKDEKEQQTIKEFLVQEAAR